MDECEIVTSRVLPAPRAQVFGAFSDPALLARWWGPAGFTSTFQSFDFTPGGAWTFVMHGPDGVSFPNESRFVEIVPEQLIVFDHVTGHTFRTTFVFADADIDDGAGTQVQWTMRFDDPGECARVARFVADANEQNLDRLAEVLRED